MPYVGGGDDFHSARKRRWDDDEEGEGIYRLYSPEKKQAADFYVLNHAQDLAARKILPLAKRVRVDEIDINDDGHFHHAHAHAHAHAPFIPIHRRKSSQQKVLQDQPGFGNKTPGRPTNATLLSPCYICHRRPTKKSDLDSFADCEGCGERTCFVCIRQCQGWNSDDISEQEVLSRSFHMADVDDDTLHDQQRRSSSPQPQQQQQQDKDTPRYINDNENGRRNVGKGWDAGGHRSVVCSRCCVERGMEGEVVCLGCLSGMPCV